MPASCLTWFYLLACTASLIGNEGTADFVLEAKVVEALEGGPVVVTLTLEYTGARPIKVADFQARRDVEIAVTGPASWKAMPKPKFFVYNGAIATKEILPHDRISRTFYLHQQYSSIPAGKAKLVLTWNVHRATQEQTGACPLVGSPSVVICVDVLPATEERLKTLCMELRAGLERKEADRAQRSHLANRILGVKHEAVIPVALQLLESDETFAVGSRDVISSLCDCLGESGSGFSRLVDYVLDPSATRGAQVIGFWHEEGITLPNREVRRLLESNRTWVKMLTFVSFPQSLDESSKDCLLREMSGERRPAMTSKVVRLVETLDNDKFADRERATRELEALGEVAEPLLRKALEGNPSPEARRRMERVLEQIDNAEQNPNAAHAIRTVELLRAPEARLVLEALAKGARDSWWTKEAKSALQRIGNRPKAIP